MEVLNKSVKLEIRSLYKRYGDKTTLDNVSFDVYDGEFLSILGPSGCGKTTLLRILIGLLEPSGGDIFADGVNITALDPSARSMGMVFQNFALFENMTVLGNVAYSLKLNKATRKNAEKTAMEMLETSSLSIKEISATCGYNNFNFFARAFKKFTGLSPTEYKKQN